MTEIHKYARRDLATEKNPVVPIIREDRPRVYLLGYQCLRCGWQTESLFKAHDHRCEPTP